MIEIHFYNTAGVRVALDIDTDQVLDIEAANPLFDYELKDGSFSLPIDAPFTASNKKNLGFPEMLEQDLINREVFWDCEVKQHGIVVYPNAKMSLLSVLSTFSYQDGVYRLVITGPESLLGSKLKGKMMNQFAYGGDIHYTSSSRRFAYDVMTGTYPQLRNVISFAPVRNPDYFDKGRDDYDNEHTDGDMLNGIWKSPSFSIWDFGSKKESDGSSLASPGDVGYGNYRTVPFFNLCWVIRQLISDVGYIVDGTFFQDERLNRLFFYNNVSLESYQGKVIDLSRKIVPARHMPSVSVVDFIAEICALFNLEMIVLGKRCYFNFRKRPELPTPIDITKYVVEEFESENSPEFYDGIKLYYSIENDAITTERMKEIEPARIRGRFNTYDEATAYTFSPSIADGDIIYVRKENYYYVFSAEHNKFIYYAEALEPVIVGDGITEKVLKASPLLKSVGVTELGGLYDLECVEIRQKGSYISNRQQYIQHASDIRLFFITSDSSGSYPVPYPISTNVMDGLSLALNGDDGIYNTYHAKWYNLMQRVKVVKVSAHIPAHISQEQLFLSGIKILNHTFIIRKINRNYGENEASLLELIKI